MAVFGVRHVGLKFVSIGVASALWLLISGQQLVERALRIPLEYTNMPPQLETSGDTPAVVDVRVRGSSAALSRVAPGELVAVLDVGSARAGRRLFHLSGTDVRVPFGVEVVQVTPSNIAIDFELSAVKAVPVVPAVQGEPADGFQVRTVSSDPAMVEVAGPAAALNRLTEAITEPVSVAGAATTVRESVNIGLADPAIRLRTPQSAMVTVHVMPVPVERTMSAVSITVKGARTSAAPKPSQVAVAVRGSRDVLEGLSVSGVQAYVDVDGLAAGQYQLPVQVVASSGVTVVRVDPARVQVNIK